MDYTSCVLWKPWHFVLRLKNGSSSNTLTLFTLIPCACIAFPLCLSQRGWNFKIISYRRWAVSLASSEILTTDVCGFTSSAMYATRSAAYASSWYSFTKSATIYTLNVWSNTRCSQQTRSNRCRLFLCGGWWRVRNGHLIWSSKFLIGCQGDGWHLI